MNKVGPDGNRIYIFALTETEFFMILYGLSAKGLAAGGANRFCNKYDKIFNPAKFDIGEFDSLFFKLLESSKYAKSIRKKLGLALEILEFLDKDKIDNIIGTYSFLISNKDLETSFIGEDQEILDFFNKLQERREGLLDGQETLEP